MSRESHEGERFFSTTFQGGSMLVLSRKIGEWIDLPGVGLSIKVVDVCRDSIKIGFNAPKGVLILRRELIGDNALPVEVKDESISLGG
jgi:carbon storage regulator CsrA